MANEYLKGTITVPSTLLITNVTKANPLVVTTSAGSSSAFINDYQVGMAVRFTVPIAYKMFQLDGLVGTITNISGSDFTVDLDSTSFDTFVNSPPALATQPASISPAGSRNYQFNNTTKKVAFKSYNNQGN